MNDISDMTHEDVDDLLSKLKLLHKLWVWEWIDYNYDVEWRGT